MNMSGLLDKYYTPIDTARELVAMGAELQGVHAVVDPACGGGSLLQAADEQWKGVKLKGLDIDRSALNILRRRCGGWDLSFGSVYPEVRGPKAWHRRVRHDLVLTNPPFSMGKKRFVEISLEGRAVRCSLAMAHLIAAVGRLRPRLGVLAVMPESALYSDLDTAVRRYIGRQLRLTVGKR